MMLVIGNGSWQITVYVLFGTIVGVGIITIIGPIASLRDQTGGPPPEDWPFRRYTTGLVQEYLKSAGKDGVEMYRRALAQDIAFLVLYGAGFVFLMDGTLGRLFRDPGSYGRLHWMRSARQRL